LLGHILYCGSDRSVAVLVSIAAAGGPPALLASGGCAQRRLAVPFQDAPHGGAVIRAVCDYDMKVIRHDGAAQDPPLAAMGRLDQSLGNPESLARRKKDGWLLLQSARSLACVGVVTGVRSARRVLLGQEASRWHDGIGNVTPLIARQP